MHPLFIKDIVHACWPLAAVSNFTAGISGRHKSQQPETSFLPHKDTLFVLLSPGALILICIQLFLGVASAGLLVGTASMLVISSVGLNLPSSCLERRREVLNISSIIK